METVWYTKLAFKSMIHKYGKITKYTVSQKISVTMQALKLVVIGPLEVRYKGLTFKLNLFNLIR